MTTQTAQVKNGVLALPKNICSDWQDSKVIVLPSKESILIKKVNKPSLPKLAPKLRKLGKMIKQQEIDDAVQWAKKKAYKSSC